MASSYTTNTGIEKPGTGEKAGTWGTMTNTNMDLIDEAINGVKEVTLTAPGSSGSPRQLTIEDGSASSGTAADTNGRHRYIEFKDGGDLGADAYVQLVPANAQKVLFCKNSLSASRSVFLFQGTYSASRDVQLLNGKDYIVKFDGASTPVVSNILDNIVIGNNLTLGSDAAVLAFGADSEITVTHSADEGLKFKNTNTGDDKPMSIYLQTGETDIAYNDYLGRIFFQAPDEGTGTDAVAIAAEVSAISEGDFSSSNNATSLSFGTGSSGSSIQKMKLSSTGVLTLNGPSGSIIIPNAGTIGSASDTDAIAISSGGDVTMSQDLAVTGAATFNGNVTLGNAASDNITVGGDFVAHLTPNADSTYNLGGTTLYWNNLYTDQIYTTGKVYFGTSSSIGVGHGAHLLFSGSGTEYGYGARAVSSSPSYFFSIVNTSGGHEGGLYMSSGTISVQNVSDYRLKQNISALTGATDKVKALNPVRFKRNDHENAVMQDGFLAHEVQAVVPEAVVGEKDAVKADGSIDPQSMSIESLIPVLTSALKEAITKIETLEQKVAALEAK